MSGLALPDVQFELPAIAPARATHHNSSVPISVTRLSSVTGTLTLSLPATGSVTSSGLSSSRSSPQSSMSVPGASLFLTSELRKRNSAGSPTTRPNSRPAIAALRPLFHAERDDAQRLERRGQPGDRRHRALDPDVVAAGRAAADANAPPAPRQAVVGGAARDGVVEVGRVEHVAIVERLEAFAGQPAAQHLDDPRAQRRRLHHAAVEEHMRRTRQAARAAADRRRRELPPAPGCAGTARGAG